MLYETRDGQNIFDVVLKTVGDIGKMYAFLAENPSIESIDSDLADFPNLVVNFTPTKSSRPADVKNIVEDQTNTYSTTGRFGQSIFDVAVMTTNNIGSIFTDLIIPSGMKSINDTKIRGIKFTFVKTDIKDVGIFNTMKQKATVVSTMEGEQHNSYNNSFNFSFN